MEHPVASFLNTAGAEPDPLADPLSTARWWASVQPLLEPLPFGFHGKPSFTMALCEDLRGLRAALVQMAAGEPATIRAPVAAHQAIHFPLLHSAAVLKQAGQLDRLRQCALEACSAYFLDQTKNGSKRWCSLRCMERARAPRRRTIGA
jgi:predicted RNA-binding Zn ribbon-like protein